MEPVVLTRDTISLTALAAPLRRCDSGAIATFEGVVRAERRPTDGIELAALEYSAYDAMAVEQMKALRTTAIERFGILDAGVAHRLGRLAIGEVSVAIAVLAGHRAEAFDACRWLIDSVKRDVPIWKKEQWSDGSESWSDPRAASR